MTFISYAQNFEDVMLWRALGSVEDGFWIDVGAADPSEYSVTRSFYDRGWHGVNIEPEPDYAAALLAGRPRDYNLQVAIGAKAGQATFHRIKGTGLSTFDQAIVAGHAASGFPVAQPMEVQVVTLAAVFAEYARRDVHFLKIDVEGAEREVLLGAELKINRPWVILAETTTPGSPEIRTDTFTDILAAAGYRQCWFDGLNTFFLAAEHEARLARHFQAPPNVFDDFIRVGEAAAMTRADVAERRIREIDEAYSTINAALSEAVAAREAEALRLKAAERRIAELDQACREAREAQSSAVAARDAYVAWHNLSAAKEKAHVLALEVEVERLQTKSLRLETELDAIRRSMSWRLTGPARAAVHRLRTR